MVITPYVGGECVFDLTARLALAGNVEVMDGGNTFNAYKAVQALRRCAADDAALSAARVLERVRLARAFTCYQLAALLEALETAQEPAGAGLAPLLVLDLLATFGDQGVGLREWRRLLSVCLGRLKRLVSAGRPVGLWVRARSVAPEEMLEFQARVERAAGRVWRLQQLAPAALLQRSLF